MSCHDDGTVLTANDDPVVALVGSLLAIEYLLLEPIKRKIESWRTFA